MAIEKIKERRNGYRINQTTSNEDFKEVLSRYQFVKKIIVNRNMAQRFRPPMFGQKRVFCINENVKDNEFYVNKFC